MAVKKGTVAALSAYLALTDVLAYLLVGWWAALLAVLFWGGVAGASIRAERRLWSGPPSTTRKVRCSNKACLTSPDPDCDCRCGGVRHGNALPPARRRKAGKGVRP